MSFKKKFETAATVLAQVGFTLDITKPAKHSYLRDELIEKFGGTRKVQFRSLNIYNSDGAVVGKWIVKYDKVTGMRGEYYNYIQHVENMCTNQGMSIDAAVFNHRYNVIKTYLLNAGKEQE